MKLLVSVRSADEAQAAITGGVDILDIKEPNFGSLGRASVETWREIVTASPPSIPVSVALGECRDFSAPPEECLAGVAYAKLGLAEIAHTDWMSRWKYCLDQLPGHVRSVAVGYVDARANAPDILEIIAAGAALGCEGLLLDTFDKSSGDLFAHLDVRQLTEIGEQAKRRGLWLALAGSLRGASLVRAAELHPAILAVRGAACRGDRRGPIDARLVRDLRLTLSLEFPFPNPVLCERLSP